MRFQLSLLTIAMIIAPCAYAEPKDLTNIERVTVIGKASSKNASLGGINLKALPINSHVVHFEELDRLKFVDPNEFLDRIPGETQVRNLRIPNGGKSYTIPMLDGMPLESPYEGATQRLDRVNTSDIERIEVIKGPASALYGNNAFGGVVNVVSNSAPEEFEAKVSIETGQYNRLRTGVNLGGKADKFGYFFDANIRQLDGMRDEAKNDKDQLSGKLSYELNANDIISTRIEHIAESVNTRGDLTQEQIDNNPTQAGKLSSSYELKQEAISVRAQLEIGMGDLDMQLARREKETNGVSRFRGPQDENDLGYTARVVYFLPLDSSGITLGTDIYAGDIKTKQYDRKDLNFAGDYTEYSSSLNINAYFAQYQIELMTHLNLIAGLRYEDINITASNYSEEANFDDLAPKLGLTYQVNSDSLLWFGASRGFYAPHMSHLFSPKSGNPDLKPEEALNIELGYRGSYENWAWDMSIYHNDISNYLVTQELMDGQGNEYEHTSNAGQVNVKGVESVFEYTPDSDNWRLGLTHTYARNTYDSFVQSTPGAKDDLSGKELRRSPKHHANVRFAWLSVEDLVIELEADLYSRYYADDANSQEAEFTRGERLNLRVSYDINNWSLWVHGLNLTDTIEDRATYSRGKMKYRTSDGRSIYAGVAYQF